MIVLPLHLTFDKSPSPVKSTSKNIYQISSPFCIFLISTPSQGFFFFLFSFFNPYLQMCYCFLTGERGKRARERETCNWSFLYMPLPGIKPKTQVCALIGTGIHSLSVYGTTRQPTEPPGSFIVLPPMPELSVGCNQKCEQYSVEKIGQSIIMGERMF